jgi:drug/metabolite transporter (DMT)-like permease
MNQRDAAAFVGLAALWGTAFVATDAALASFPPVLLAALRFDIAAAILFAVVFASGREWRPSGRRDWAPILAGGALNIGAHHAFLFAGQQYVSPAVAATLLGLVPVLTPAVTHVARPAERLSATGAAGILVGFVGVALIADPDLADVGGNLGVVLVLASAVVWVFGAVFTRGDRSTLSSLPLHAWTILAGAVSLHVAALALPGSSLAASTPTLEALGWLVYLAVAPGALGFFAYFRLLERLGPIQMGLLEYAIPPFAALFGWLVLSVSIASRTVLGFLAILAAFLLVQGGSIRRALRERRLDS